MMRSPFFSRFFGLGRSFPRDAARFFDMTAVCRAYVHYDSGTVIILTNQQCRIFIHNVLTGVCRSSPGCGNSLTNVSLPIRLRISFLISWSSTTVSASTLFGAAGSSARALTLLLSSPDKHGPNSLIASQLCVLMGNNLTAVPADGLVSHYISDKAHCDPVAGLTIDSSAPPVAAG